MKFGLVFLLACLLGSAVAPLCSGVDLMELKKKEEERRKKLAKSKIAVTDANVNSISVGGKRYSFVQMESDEPPAKGEAAAAKADKKKESPEKQPDYWKKQQDELNQKIAGLRTDIENAQMELNRLWSDFYLKSIPAEQDAIRSQIAQLTGEMEQKKLTLQEAEAQLEELLEKARKAGVPPGWLR